MSTDKNNFHIILYSKYARNFLINIPMHLSSKVSFKNKAILRNMFRSLLHDESAPVSYNEGLVDERLGRCMLSMDDPEIIPDLRKLNGKP